MNDIDAKFAEFKQATGGLKAPEGFEARVALAVVAAPASAAATVFSLKFKALLAFLIGAGVLVGVRVASLEVDEPVPAPQSAPGAQRTVAPQPTAHDVPPRPPPRPTAQHPAKADSPVPTLPQPDQLAKTTVTSAADTPPARTDAEPRLGPAPIESFGVTLAPPVITWPAPSCERSHVALPLTEKLPLAKVRRWGFFPSALRTLIDLPHAPIVVGRFAGAASVGEAFGDEVTAFEHGWFSVSRSALPVWVRVPGTVPMKLEAGEALPTDDSTYVGELRVHPSNVTTVAVINVVGDFTNAHAVVDLAELPCGANRTSRPRPTQHFTLAPGPGTRRTLLLDHISPGPSLATLHGDGLVEERAIFEPTEALSPLTFSLERVVELDAEYLIVSTPAVSENSHTLTAVSANVALNFGTEVPLELTQRSGIVSFATGADWRGFDTERTGRLVDARVSLSGLGPLSGVVKPGHMYLVQHGSTFVLLRFSRRP